VFCAEQNPCSSTVYKKLDQDARTARTASPDDKVSDHTLEHGWLVTLIDTIFIVVKNVKRISKSRGKRPKNFKEYLVTFNVFLDISLPFFTTMLH
jgi:hypothetical protein